MSDRASATAEPQPLPGTDAWEQDLLRRFREGEGAAFGQLLRFHQRSVFSLVCRLVGRHEEAEEVVQEAFLQAFRAVRRFPEVRPFRPWLFRVAVNVSRNHLRAAARRETPRELPEAGLAPWQWPPGSPEEHALRAADGRGIEAALAALTAEERALFLLRCNEGLSYDELAQIFDKRESALRVRYHRVLQRLRQQLGEGKP